MSYIYSSLDLIEYGDVVLLKKCQLTWRHVTKPHMKDILQVPRLLGLIKRTFWRHVTSIQVIFDMRRVLEERLINNLI